MKRSVTWRRVATWTVTNKLAASNAFAETELPSTNTAHFRCTEPLDVLSRVLSLDPLSVKDPDIYRGIVRIIRLFWSLQIN